MDENGTVSLYSALYSPMPLLPLGMPPMLVPAGFTVSRSHDFEIWRVFIGRMWGVLPISCLPLLFVEKMKHPIGVALEKGDRLVWEVMGR